MLSLKGLKVVTQLVAGFAAVIVLMVGLGVFCLFEVSGENVHVAEFRDNWLPSVRSSQQMLAGLRQARINEYRATSSQNPAAIQDAEARIDAGMADYRGAAADYEKLITEPQERAAFAEIQVLMQQYLDIDRQMRALVKDGKAAQALDLLTGKSSTVRDALEKDMKTIVEINVAGAAREGQAASDAYSRTIVLVIGFITAAAIVALGVALLIARGVGRQLGGEPRDAAMLASQIAGGNLRVGVPLKRGDRSSLMFSLGAMKDQLTSIVQGIKASSESISVAAGEIAQGNSSLSQRTEEQAASLEETASSMQELTSTVRHNADSAKRATALAVSASGVAQRGGQVVGRVVETMRGISDSSSRVAEIIGVIEGIAFQTNILALNAAVEAARAGDQGRGFAVVAGEVRTLAQRSATAAKEIKELIGESVARVDAGSRLVEEAGGTIGEIVQSVKSVTDIMNEISSASEAQSTGIEQINQAVCQMDEVTQQNAALVEEASAAAQSMAQQAQVLREAVAVFRVGDVGSASISPTMTAGRAAVGSAALKLA
ncbi:methyl-accepting chemotaxis protein [Paraburkholderia flagellata]|uniref:methyl-accepting chemotaxis protein n=1 Tax=Paraburkholderia flagellata TaxID=2883241 RepID=UPI001F20FA45|nr:methyl-accepting chemotaxis protein [Paraburkholderia flagellata]